MTRGHEPAPRTAWAPRRPPDRPSRPLAPASLPASVQDASVERRVGSSREQRHISSTRSDRDRRHRHAGATRTTHEPTLTGHVIGFALRPGRQRHGKLCISRDTDPYNCLRQLAHRVRTSTAMLQLTKGGSTSGKAVTAIEDEFAQAPEAAATADPTRPQLAITVSEASVPGGEARHANEAGLTSVAC